MRTVGVLFWYCLGSSLAFGLASGVGAFVVGGTSLPPHSLGLSVGMAQYGAFHWALLGAVTFPLFVIPLAAFALTYRHVSTGSAPKFRMLAYILALAAAAVVLRAVVLEYPTLLASPATFVKTSLLCGNGLCELVGFAGGLLAVLAWIGLRRTGRGLRHRAPADEVPGG